MNPTLLSKLRHLRLSGMAEALPGRLTQATAASLPHLEFLELLVEDELNRRADRLFTRRVKHAEIAQIKEIKDFDWAFNPKIPRAKLAELAAWAEAAYAERGIRALRLIQGALALLRNHRKEAVLGAAKTCLTHRLFRYRDLRRFTEMTERTPPQRRLTDVHDDIRPINQYRLEAL